jgi:four helix bundle protein
LFPKEELHILSPQIKRAADSTGLKIAEGSAGQSDAAFNRFFGYALRSSIEFVGCIFVARKRQIISDEKNDLIYKKVEELIKMIQSIRNKL